MLHLGHLNITVRDTRRSAEFYARWFGFDRPLADYEDGTRFMTDASGFELALHPGPRPSDPAGDWHFGLVATEPGEVHELMSSLAFAGVRVSDPEDEPGYVGFKCRDPDGYLIEVYWEPRA